MEIREKQQDLEKQFAEELAKLAQSKMIKLTTQLLEDNSKISRLKYEVNGNCIYMTFFIDKKSFEVSVYDISSQLEDSENTNFKIDENNSLIIRNADEYYELDNFIDDCSMKFHFDLYNPIFEKIVIKR